MFGAKFDEKWRVVHAYTETVEGLSAFRGSKYVQSIIGNSYIDAKHFLDLGREVLFSGTPCQIAGLKRFLRNDYRNLISVDVICHGVPSPWVWNSYVNMLKPVSDVSFRNKRAGWKKSGFSAKTKIGERYELQQQNAFLRGFLQNLYLRPSCHRCAFRNFRSGSDFTIGDFWGIQDIFPFVDDYKGVSLVIQNEIGRDVLGYRLNTTIVCDKDINRSFLNNVSLFKDYPSNKNRSLFFSEFQKQQNRVVELIRKYTEYHIKCRIKNVLIRFMLTIGIYDIFKLAEAKFPKIRKHYL